MNIVLVGRTVNCFRSSSLGCNLLLLRPIYSPITRYRLQHAIKILEFNLTQILQPKRKSLKEAVINIIIN